MNKKDFEGFEEFNQFDHNDGDIVNPYEFDKPVGSGASRVKAIAVASAGFVIFGALVSGGAFAMTGALPAVLPSAPAVTVVDPSVAPTDSATSSATDTTVATPVDTTVATPTDTTVASPTDTPVQPQATPAPLLQPLLCLPSTAMTRATIKTTTTPTTRVQTTRAATTNSLLAAVAKALRVIQTGWPSVAFKLRTASVC